MVRGARRAALVRDLLTFGAMRLTYPGGFLTLLMILTCAVLAATLYFQWWPMAGLFAVLALCHVGLLFQVRAAAWGLVLAYVVGCVIFAVSFYSGFSSISVAPWRFLGKLAFNLCVLHELHLWLRRHA